MAHDHAHDHTHDHAHSHELNLTHVSRALVIGISLNLAFVVVEAAAGFFQNSLALMSDAGHNLFDVASLALALVAFRLQKVPPTDQYTYGLRKTTILVALANAVVLLVGVGGIGIEAVMRLFHPRPLSGGVLAIVAGAGILINGATAFLFLRDKDRDLNLKGAYLHMVADALVSLGVVTAGILIMVTGAYWLDPVISFVIMAVIVVSTWSLLKDSLRLSLDGVPREVDMKAVRAAAMKVPGLLDIHHIHVWAMSTTENAMTAHLVVSPGMAISETEDIKEKLRGVLASQHISHFTFEVESQDHGCCTETVCDHGASVQAHLHAGHTHP